MNAFEAMKRELVHELGDTANKAISRIHLGKYVGARRLGNRYQVFANRNDLDDSLTYENFLACVLLSNNQQKHKILSSVEQELGMDGDLEYFSRVGEEIANQYNLDYDPLAGLVGSLRQPGNSFYNIKDGKAGLEELMNSPVSARGKNSGYRTGNKDPLLELDFRNPPVVYFDKEYAIDGLFLEPETPRLFLSSGPKYFSETSLQVGRHYITAEEESQPENIINLKHLRNGEEAVAFKLLHDELELFIDNIGLKKSFPGYDFTGIKYFF